jgi:hypothetical protein
VYNVISNLPGNGNVYFDETYANGDGTDSWCSNNQPIPIDMYYNQKYLAPECGKWSCNLGDLEQPSYYYLYPDVDHPPTVTYCSDMNSNLSLMYILCV